MAEPATGVLQRLATYLGTGAASFLVDAGGLYVLHALLGVPLVIAAPTSFLASFAVNFTLNQRYTFRADTAGYRAQLVKFTLLVGFNTLATTVIVAGLASAGVNFMVAKVVSTGLLMALNYVVLRRWVFTAGS